MTSGTATLPEATTIDTEDLRCTDVPETGSVRTTSPESTPAASSEVTLPTVSPAPSMAVRASAWVLPVTSGTLTMAEPEEKWTVTVVP